MLRSVDEENVRSELKPKEDAKRAIEPKQKKKKDDKAFSEQHPSGKRFDDLIGDDYALPDESDPAWDEALEVCFFVFFFCFLKKNVSKGTKGQIPNEIAVKSKSVKKEKRQRTHHHEKQEKKVDNKRK